MKDSMMKEKHIVLRGSGLVARDLAGRPRAAAAGGDVQVEVRIEEIERRDLPKLMADANVFAVAPSIPMRLIKPLDHGEATAAQTGDIAWGVKAVKADTSPMTGDGVVVAILDTGIDPTHPAFAGVTLVRKNFTSEGDDDTVGHGTHCAGTVFGRKVGATRIGVAPGVTRVLIGKVLGEQGGSSESIVSAIQWANENGAHVISMSLGMDFPGYQEELVRQGLPAALATSRALEGYRANVMLFERLASLIHAQAQPTVIVAAAGNESRRDLDPNFEIAVSPPAVSDGLVSVAALGQTAGGLDVAFFSNTGAIVSGPGVEVVSAAMGGGLRTMSGTSMATPHVAGVAALWAQRIMQQGPLSPIALTARLVGNATLQGLRAGIDPFDVGSGLVIAPQA
jgi:subtilisin family serine protease